MSDLPCTIESVEVFLVEPPRLWVSNDGVIMRTIAEYANDDHERVDLGVVATGPSETGLAVLGFVGTEIIFKEELPVEPEVERVRYVEDEAANTILTRLGLLEYVS